jgi:hypothetical protein
MTSRCYTGLLEDIYATYHLLVLKDQNAYIA